MKRRVLVTFFFSFFFGSFLYGFSTFGADSSFYIVIASDPQLDWECVTPDCRKVANSVREQASLSNLWQTQSINKFATSLGSDFKGVIVNGDLTAFGHTDELRRYVDEFRNKIHAPVFPGLGNHDYANNVDDCWNNNCAVRMVLYLNDEVQKMGSQIKGYDLEVSGNYYKFPSVRKSYRGSLSYSFEIDGVHFIQLNNYPSYQATFDSWNFGKARRDHFSIQPAFDWLEKDLSAAAQEGKSIVINLHDFEEHFLLADRDRFLTLFNRYGVSSIFYGHFHTAQGRSYTAGNIPAFISGSSSNNKYLLVKFVNGRVKTISVVNSVNGDTAIDQTYSL